MIILNNYNLFANKFLKLKIKSLIGNSLCIKIVKKIIIIHWNSKRNH